MTDLISTLNGLKREGEEGEGKERSGANGTEWVIAGGVEEDPEETRVMFCALDSFAGYARVAHYRLTHMRRQSFYALPQSHIKLLSEPPFSLLETLDHVDDAIEANADLARAIVRCGLRDFASIRPSSDSGVDGSQAEPEMPRQWRNVAKHSDVDKARSTLRQFYRDWTVDGAAERVVCFDPVFRAVDQEMSTRLDRGQSPVLDVLVPGAGLGRLVFELCRRGCNTEGNEISYHQLLASSYVLNHTARAGQHTIFPWIQTFSNHQSRANHLRSYAVPDVLPAAALAAAAAETGRPAGNMSMCASDFLCAYSEPTRAASFDVVASVFFLDTAPNLIRYLEVMKHALRPGGILVNFGPLLWHWENTSPGLHGPHGDDGDGPPDTSEGARGIADPGSFELADDEVMLLLEKLGFVVEWRQTGIRTGYIQDPDSMLQNTYLASAWVARKPL